MFITPQHIPNENRRQKWNLPRQIWTVKFVWSNIEHTYIHTYIVMLTLRKRFPSNNAFPLNFALDWISRLDFHISLTFTSYVNYYTEKNYFIVKKFSYFNIQQNENNFRDTIFLQYFIQDKIINYQTNIWNKSYLNDSQESNELTIIIFSRFLRRHFIVSSVQHQI